MLLPGNIGRGEAAVRSSAGDAAATAVCMARLPELA
jgi:hypothetical protein